MYQAPGTMKWTLYSELYPKITRFDMNLCIFVTFMRTDRFGSLTENDVTGGADLMGYLLEFIYGIKGRF